VSNRVGEWEGEEAKYVFKKYVNRHARTSTHAQTRTHIYKHLIYTPHSYRNLMYTDTACIQTQHVYRHSVYTDTACI